MPTDDKQLQDAVLAELRFEPSIDATDIGVLAEGGVVTLAGHVPGYPQKLAAQRATWRVKGVQALVDELQVKLQDAPPSDEDIARRALAVLRWDSTVPRDIHLVVANGKITIEGAVDWQFQKKNAEIDLQKLAGLTGIDNRLVVRPSADPVTVRSQIEQALTRSAEVRAQDLVIDVHEHTVTLQGRAETWQERKAIERAAWSAPGVSSVVNRIEIAG